MFRSSKELHGYKITAVDGECGSLSDLLFDDVSHVVRYIVVETGSWLSTRKVLISPVAVGDPDREDHRLPTALSRANIEQAPGIETDQTVSRQHEIELATFHNWPMYWGFGAPATAVATTPPLEAEDVSVSDSSEPHLRSVREVTGYHIQCMEGELGHVEDVIVDTNTWALRYLVIDTRNWLPGKKVIIAFDWITHFTWEDRKAHVDLTLEQVKQAPEYDPALPVNRVYEQTLYDFYGRPRYW